MSRRLPSLNWLRVFEAAARTESFARAAERLAMSAPAVSQQIRALEAHLGQALFTRAASGVTLTESGRSLLMVVGDALDRMETAATDLAGRKAQKLVLGVSLTLASGWLAPRLPRFLEAHPEITLEIHSLLGRPEIPPRQAEIWIAFGPSPPGTEAVHLFGERLVPVAHPDLTREMTSPNDLLAHTIIEVLDHRRNWAQVFNRDFLPENTRVLQVDTTLAAMSIAAARGGIALARRPASDELVERFGLAPCLPDFELGGVEAYSLLHAAGAKLSKGAATFKSWIIEQARATRHGSALP